MKTSEQEWLEANGSGGFASGSVDGLGRRRYHGLLQVPHPDGGDRVVLVNALELHLVTPTGRYPLSSHCYSPGVVSPDSRGNLVRFAPDPWPTWRFRAPDGTELIQEILVPRGQAATLITWRLVEPTTEAYLAVRPLLSGRDAHALHRENEVFDFEPDKEGDWMRWTPYPGMPGVALGSNATYAHDPAWYRNFRYEQDLSRGYDYEEDLASPGQLTWDLEKGDAVLICAAIGTGRSSEPNLKKQVPLVMADGWRREERERRARRGGRRRLEDYLVEDETEVGVLGGLPWFDQDLRSSAFMARVLVHESWGLPLAGRIIERGLRARPDRDSGPVDGHLWMLVVAHEFLEAVSATPDGVEVDRSKRIRALMLDLLSFFARTDEELLGKPWLAADGLLQVGPARTWMNGRVGDRWVTPRSGKPVEIEALWLNALRIGSLSDSAWEPMFEAGLKAFRSLFWNREMNCLYDVVDGDGGPDAAIRPNQLLALGGLPFPLLRRVRAALVLETVEEHLLTPAGLRTLDPRDLAYRGFCRGGEWERIAAMHQGTAWFWLLGSFIEAWLHIKGRNEKNLAHVRLRFLKPAQAYLGLGMAGHMPEMADGNPPNPWRGSPAFTLSDTVLARLDQQLGE